MDLIFGVEMTMSIGCYFCWLAQTFCEILNVILINDYVKNRILYAILVSTWCLYYIFKLLFINYVCEKISAKANATGDLINRIPYCNVNHENVSQPFNLKLSMLNIAKINTWF
ncbi:uncharacterized protein LOC114255506 [Monomorium pharaonis]|uniref:uncharacterized protein LOC114255506 n=1 Tax=Monomorium pharaonis TaxID=307658 RepID=UPI00102E1A0D|nr:uncharacterized protein LOC114255506 [Monomorium pharaonis]